MPEPSVLGYGSIFHVYQELRLRRVHFDLLPQVVHVRVNDAVGEEEVLAPHLGNQLIVRQDLAAVCDERAQ